MNAPVWLEHAILTYGYWVVLGAVALESMGVPFPGETSLLTAAVFAGSGHSLNIVWVIIFAAAGAILGDNLGFTIGWFGGYPLVRRLLRLLHVRETLLEYTQRYFERHGDKTVFLGRFISLLRATVAFLAGVNHMSRRKFVVWNAAGGIVWATVFGLLGYFLGKHVDLLMSVVRIFGIGGSIAAVVVAAILFVVWKRRRDQRETALRFKADADQPSFSPEKPAPDLKDVIGAD